MSEKRHCPVPGCHDRLGTTRQGDPWLMCRRHWLRVDVGLQNRLWRSYRAWQRLERQYMRARSDGADTAALLNARALAIVGYIGIRNDAIKVASRGEEQQLEVAL